MIRLSGLRRVTYKGEGKFIFVMVGNVTINNDIVSIIKDGDASSETIIFKERIIKIEKVQHD